MTVQELRAKFFPKRIAFIPNPYSDTELAFVVEGERGFENLRWQWQVLFPEGTTPIQAAIIINEDWLELPRAEWGRIVRDSWLDLDAEDLLESEWEDE